MEAHRAHSNAGSLEPGLHVLVCAMYVNMQELLMPQAKCSATHGYCWTCSPWGAYAFSVLTQLLFLSRACRYELARSKLAQSLRVWAHNNPAGHAEYHAEHALQHPHWHVNDSLAALEQVRRCAWT